jgi:hypothetical protein
MTRYTLSRSSFIPKGAIKVADKASDAIGYVYSDGRGRPCARVFFGKQAKPVSNYSYASPAARQKHVAEMFARRQAWQARKAAEKANAVTYTYTVGEILSTCWGYEQTNREFYEVVRVSGSAVTVRQIATETVSTGWATDRVVPLPGAHIGEEIRRMARRGCTGLKMNSSATARPHDFEMVAGVKVYRPVSTSSYH